VESSQERCISAERKTEKNHTLVLTCQTLYVSKWFFFHWTFPGLYNGVDEYRSLRLSLTCVQCQQCNIPVFLKYAFECILHFYMELMGKRRFHGRSSSDIEINYRSQLYYIGRVCLRKIICFVTGCLLIH
jgi:hypothetical protein